MLKFLTHKLKSQSITDVRPLSIVDNKSDDERDSGTESDDENIEIENIINDDDGNHHDTSSYGSLSPVNHPPSPGQLDTHLGLDDDPQIMDRTHEITENSVETISFASELEGRTWEFGRHSSEEELAQINREGVAEKRKWSQVLRNGCCDSAGSSDEEVRELMLRPQPVLFRASPPKGVQKLTHSHSPPAKYFFTNVSRVAVAAISPRKRHRQISVTEVDQDSGVQRPCLDFEKMQKTSVKKPYTHSFGRPKIVKIRTIAGSTRSPKCLFDPSVFSFRAINTTYNQLAPVEEPSCAY